jgi:hypothetical protein
LILGKSAGKVYIGYIWLRIMISASLINTNLIPTAGFELVVWTAGNSQLGLSNRSHLSLVTEERRSQASAVVYRWAMGWMIGVRVPAGAGNFSPHHRVQTGSGAHPASYPMGTTSSFPGNKAAGA